MIQRIRLAAIAVLGALLLAVAPASAEDKACAYCEAVKHVSAAVHCGKCKADKPCESCAALAKRITEATTCPDCDEATKKVCKECAEYELEAGCKFCAEKKAVVEEAYCSTKCDDVNKPCEKCEAFRKQITAIECKDCAAKKKG